MRHILCPVDFSELSAQALRRAAAFAHCFEGRITVLHASRFEAPPYFTQGQVAELERAFREARSQAGQELRAFISRTLAGERPDLASVVLEAPPAEAIRQYATEIRADLIVMGTHGRTGFSHFMLGSVAERVLRESGVPVLTVRPGAGSEGAFRNLLCPVNDTAVSRKALGMACLLARCAGASLTVLHVEEPHGARAIDDLPGWVQQAERMECEVRTLVRKGDPQREIVAAARELGADLLVVGAQHRAFFEVTVMGSTSVRVVRHAPCPVLAVIAEAKEAASTGLE